LDGPYQELGEAQTARVGKQWQSKCLGQTKAQKKRVVKLKLIKKRNEGPSGERRAQND
jgi:hypothetical protein